MPLFNNLIAGPWIIVNDGVMGGCSTARVGTAESTLTFEGQLSLANNGGFSSIRHVLADPPRGARGVRLEARGDGHEYQLRLRQGHRFDDIAWRVPFRAPGDWRLLEWAFDAFEPVFRGQSVPGKGKIDPDDIGQVGFLVAGSDEGPFRLEVRQLVFIAPRS